jgi:hypothetical protein
MLSWISGWCVWLFVIGIVISFFVSMLDCTGETDFWEVWLFFIGVGLLGIFLDYIDVGVYV